MVWQIELSATALKQLRKLDPNEARRITHFYASDYRIICDIQDRRLCILVIEVGDRRDVYG